jgi:hypothetical protein
MYLDRDYFRSSWLWFANYRHVELWNAVAHAYVGNPYAKPGRGYS